MIDICPMVRQRDVCPNAKVMYLANVPQTFQILQ
jgi:hypothetical protein